jgi:hypothetical protein
MAEDEKLAVEDLEESLDDLDGIANWAEGAALWSTDWTAETILSQLRRGSIDLNPSFQRRSAWTQQRQSLFIESLILGLPIPQLILAEAKEKKGSFVVIDGKQRLLAIRRFGALTASDDFEPLKLKGLGELSRLNDKTYEDLRNDKGLADDLSAFENASIRTIVIRNWQNEAYLYEVFLRINTGSVQLSPQELRQALHPGPFSDLIDDASAASPELKRALKLDAPDFRMRDAELLLRYLAYKNFIGIYDGNLKRFLDTATLELNRRWGDLRGNMEEQVSEFERGLAFTREVFGDRDYLRKWNGNSFERRVNRAVFDIMIFYFSDPAIRNAMGGKLQRIVDSFKRLCTEDPVFKASIETTTKSMAANQARFSKWGACVSEIAGIGVVIPFHG